MIFKSSFLTSIRENIKRRTWVFALTVIAYVMTYPVAKFLLASSCYEREEVAYGTVWEILTFGFDEWTIILAAAVGVITGLQGYGYLHNKRKLDFYQSVPVNQTKRFFSIYLGGYVMFLLAYLPQLLLSILVVAWYQPLYEGMVASALTGIVIHLLIFSLFYHLAIVAVMLTGNVIISLVAMGVLFLYELALRLLVEGFCATFFHTFYYGGRGSNLQLQSVTSPAYVIGKFMSNLQEYAVISNITLELFLMSLVLLGIGYLVYRIRKVDGCNRAVAFKGLNRPLKYLIIIPTSMASGMLFYSVSMRTGIATYVGVILAAIVLHMVFEVIYGYDVKACLRGYKDMIVITTVSILLVVGFQYDLIGYDSYVPKANQLESYALIGEGNKNQWVDLEEMRTNYEYGWHEENEMFITDTEEILGLANLSFHQNYPKEVSDSPVTSLYVLYRFTNGTTKYRKVYVDRLAPESMAYMDAIYGREAFRTASDPLYSEEMDALIHGLGDMTVEVTTSEGDFIYPKEQQVKLLEALQEEYGSMNYTMQASSMPIAVIDISSTVFYENENGREDSCRFWFTYPIYEDFRECSALIEHEVALRQDEYANEERIDFNHIENIFVYDYDEKSKWEKTLSVDELQEVAEYLIPTRLYEYNGRFLYYYGEDPEYATIDISYKDGISYSYVVPVGRLPE